MRLGLFGRQGLTANEYSLSCIAIICMSRFTKSSTSGGISGIFKIFIWVIDLLMTVAALGYVVLARDTTTHAIPGSV